MPMETIICMQNLRQEAMNQNLIYHEKYLMSANRGRHPQKFWVGQQILLSAPPPINVNRKLFPKYTGPFTITQLINDTNVEILANNSRKFIIHVDRIKPFLSPEKGRDLDLGLKFDKKKNLDDKNNDNED